MLLRRHRLIRRVRRAVAIVGLQAWLVTAKITSRRSGQILVLASSSPVYRRAFLLQLEPLKFTIGTIFLRSLSG